ncbi:Oidioi.mRNA.OKI2018_I69.chr2.g4277.t1.cds [Oikopleura dioica]|uniref:Oidioi.mRNA.OKI2018_I69.chr2.g4277.t1.cds n=1 Tax=Oikopleura dioica TaxID=34765 RepID=A0ABN7T2A1_OIKDI|nr:Oidioi.mRNA.OKI2018_I69.chr2.g4277.t1.cds [Oikopleura dioica]
MKTVKIIKPKGEIISDGVNKAERMIVEGEKLILDGPLPGLSGQSVVETRDAVSSSTTRTEEDIKKVASLLLKQPEMPSLVVPGPIPEGELVAMKKIKKAAEKIIENDKEYLKMDVMKFSQAAGQLRDFVLENEEDDPLLNSSDVNPFTPDTLCVRFKNLFCAKTE